MTAIIQVQSGLLVQYQGDRSPRCQRRPERKLSAVSMGVTMLVLLKCRAVPVGVVVTAASPVIAGTVDWFSKTL
ncbi:hypothetical protein MAUB1S_11556 [Mycolicibacterium aubagnense]